IALSSLFPPFEATAPTVLSQLFRTIEERYHGDALQCLLNFLIPAKHILESVQQAACAAYSDVLFRCEGWPLCLRDRVVIQLAPINPLLLRPGDFYLQVEPFGEQSARIVLKSLLVQEDLLGQENLVLQASSRLLEGTAIEGTPIPETSYPCIFTESWLREINEGRHGNPLCQCVLSSDQGVVKVPWTEVANPEFLDRPKSNIWLETRPCSTPTLRVTDLKTEISNNESQVPIGLLPLEMETSILPANDGMAVSVQLVDGGSRLMKVDQGHPISSFAGKPVGWVSPNTWDSRHNRELEGEYVDLLEFNKEKETLVLNNIAMPTKPLAFKLVRTTQPAPTSNVNLCEENCNPCMQNKPPESMQNDPESKCRYRQSYMAALRNPVNFERASMLPSLDETRTDEGEAEPSCEGYGVGLRLKPSSCTFGQTPNQADRNPMQSFENSVQQKQSPKNSSQSIPHDCSSRENAESSDQHMTQQILSMVQARQQHKSFLTGQQDLHQTALGTKALPDKRQHCLNNSFRHDSFQMRISGQKHAKTQHLPKMGLRAFPDHSGHRQDANLRLQGFNPIQLTQASKQTPPPFQPQFSQILFQNENKPLDYKVFCDDRHSGRGPGSPVQVIKGKSRSKSRSSSSVSETTKECLQSHKPTNRSRSDVYPEIIPMLPAIQGIKHTANLVSPKLNRRQEARKEVCSSGKAGTPGVNGVELQKSDADQLLTGQPENGVQATLFSQDPTIKSLLQLGIICLPGSRDRAGRAVVEVYGGRKGWASSQLSPHEFCRLLLYLHSIPRMEVRELGLTVVIDSRKCPLPSVFYKSLLMVQEQALHAVHTILMLVDKETNPRLEKHPGLQVINTPKHTRCALLIYSTCYYYEDKLSLFQLDLQAASSLLQTAIRRLDVKKTDTAKDVQSCIQQQRSSMKMVLEDTRLVALQREGGSILARMRKEESRFAQSEDCRDSLESVTCLYNQVEEAVHTLVMKSNRSLQHLEHVLLLREAEDSLSTIQKWCDAEEQSWQKDKDDTEKTLLKIEQGLKDVQSVLIRAKEKKEKAMLLIKEVERKSKGTHYPETEAFACNATTFKTNMTGFLLKAEERKSELETSVDLYRFCEEASSLVKECMEYLEHIQSTNSPVCVSLSTLKAFEERFKDFSPQHFQDKSSALLERHPDGIWMWNAVWAQCRDIRQRLTEILQASYRNQTPLGSPKKDSVACLKGPTLSVITTSLGENEGDPQINPAGGRTETRNGLVNETVTHFHLHCEPVTRETSLSSNSDLVMTQSTHKELHLQQSFKPKEEGGGQHFHQSRSKVSTSHNGPTMQLRKCLRIYSHSDSDLRKSGRVTEVNHSPHYTALVRSRSEGSCLPVANYHVSVCKTAVKHKVQICAASSQESNSSRASWDGQSSKLSHQDSFCSSASGLSQSDVNEKFSSDTKSDEQSLISPDLPVQTQDESVFKARKENFGLYALYSKNKPRSERLLIDHGREFFKEKQQLLGDKMDLSSYLLKPVQRISKYGLLLQDMLRECETGAHAGHERLEIQTALNIIQFQLRHGNDLLTMDDIQDCDVNLKEQGQLIRQDEFVLTFRKKKCYRHIFLFQDLILFSKTRRTDVGNDTYIYKQSFKTSDIGMTHNSGDSGLCFEIWFRRRKSQDTYVLQASSREVKENWTRDLERILWEQAVLNREIRIQERVFMGIGHKPFMDIQPSEMAINDRAINCSPTGRGGIPVLRLNSVGSASCTSSSGSHSSSSSGWGSTSPVGHLSGGDVVRYIHGTSGIEEEDDLDQESGNQSTLVESSVSSGESVSCFSSSGHSCSSVIGGDCDHAQSEAPVIGVKKACAHNHGCSMKPTNPPGQTRDHSCTTVRHSDLSVLILLMEFLHCALPFPRHLSYFIAIFQLC
uniref:Quattro n=1 Tax=Cyprinus carpio TaxID=7962 RepID=A0A8C2GPV2_CYPCA